MIARPAIFKWRQTEPGLILCAVRWYLRYSLSLRDVGELLEERGLDVDHTTVWRWVQYYGPELGDVQAVQTLSRLNRQNALFGDAVKSGLRRIGSYGSNHAACADSALHHADNALLIGIAWRWTATLRSTLALCTEIAFVHLY